MYRHAAQEPILVGLRQRVKVAPGRTYRLSCWVRTQGDGDLTGRCLLTALVGEQSVETKYGNRAEWTQVALRFESGDREWVEISAGYMPVSDKTNIVRYDDFMLLPVK
jgi:hypothetical protein